VGGLDQPVRQRLDDGVDDDLAVAADTASEVDEGVDAAALGPWQPPVQGLDCRLRVLLAGDGEDRAAGLP
jgi:hypothetical protein